MDRRNLILRISQAAVNSGDSVPSDAVIVAGLAIGRLCEKCDGKCVICDSYVRPCTLVRICDECNYGSYQGRCVICGGPGVSDAYYCKECTIQEKDRDGCPKIVNLGSSKTDLFYERKKYGFKKR
ncbi:PHD finger-like domain-containing protein 5A isoform X1 [Podarcis muralis]|uniref:PHD finger-like domain-containing protein 5A isoform X1 n=1 Tax=Podarcis muralis TaxID=64176 RepID=UPI00109FB159|nr:PHD finger-like domain-containing protein 5A isoform X1 [Podarcis muralis]